MKFKKISDIRFYKYKFIEGQFFPVQVPYNNKELNIIIHRVVMKLRENDFSLGEHDHLYICFCDGDEGLVGMLGFDNSYTPWATYYPIRVTDELYNNLDNCEYVSQSLEWARKILIDNFTSDEDEINLVNFCFDEAINKAEDMKMKYKEKINKDRKAVIYLRYLNNSKYYPLLRVYNNEGKILFEKDLSEALTLDQFGQLQVTNNKVTIIPRKNSYNNLEKIIYEY